MVTRKTLVVLSLDDILTYLGFVEEAEKQLVVEYGFWNAVTWGDTPYTLVSASTALEYILDGVDGLYSTKGQSPMSLVNNHDIREKFWGGVNPSDFVNVG